MSGQLKRLYATPDRKQINAALKYRSLAYSDYISARILLRNEQHMQAVVLAATAVEKYFKVIISAQNLQRVGYLGNRMIRTVKSSAFEYEKLNDSFIRWLSEMYVMRNYDSIPRSFKAIVSRNNTLSEIDSTINEIETAIGFENEKGEDLKSSYETDRENNKPELCGENWLCAGGSQKEFIEGLDIVTYTIRDDVGALTTISMHSEYGHGIYEKDFFAIKPGLQMIVPGKPPRVATPEDGAVTIVRA